MEETGRGKKGGRGKRVGRVKNKEKKKKKEETEVRDGMQTKDCLANLTPNISTQARYDGGGEICKTARALCRKNLLPPIRFPPLLSFRVYDSCDVIFIYFTRLIYIYVYKRRLQRDEIQHLAFFLFARR